MSLNQIMGLLKGLNHPWLICVRKNLKFKYREYYT